MSIKDALARHCENCPACKFARRRPDHWFGRLVLWHGTWCPCWKAWEDVYGTQAPPPDKSGNAH